MEHKNKEIGSCQSTIRAVHDAMYLVGGKWKISIIASLSYGAKRYSEILKDVNGISGKMLSRELKEMEMNKLITREVLSTRPIKVQYELTKYGQNLNPVIKSLADWGATHRKVLFRK